MSSALAVTMVPHCHCNFRYYPINQMEIARYPYAEFLFGDGLHVGDGQRRSKQFRAAVHQAVALVSKPGALALDAENAANPTEGVVVNVSSLLIFAGALVVAAGLPGPSIAALVARVLAKGWRDVLPFLAAMWIGEALWLSLAVFGLAVVAQTFHLLFVIIKYLGVGYLLNLAWKMWSMPVVANQGALPRGQSASKLFLAGMAVTLGNPKIMVFYMALLPSIIDLTGVTTLGWSQLTLTMLAVLVAVDMSWVVLAAQARRFLRSERATRAANRAGAGMMAGAAVAIATR